LADVQLTMPVVVHGDEMCDTHPYLHFLIDFKQYNFGRRSIQPTP